MKRLLIPKLRNLLETILLLDEAERRSLNQETSAMLSKKATTPEGTIRAVREDLLNVTQLREKERDARP